MDDDLQKIVFDLAEDLMEGAGRLIAQDLADAAPCVNTMTIPNSISADPGVERQGTVFCVTIRQDASGEAFYGPILNNPPQFIESKTTRGPNGGGILSDGPGGSFFVAAKTGEKARVKASQKYKGWFDDFDFDRSLTSAVCSVSVS